MRLVLTDHFNLSMFKEESVSLVITRIEPDEVCIALENAQDDGYLVNMVEDEDVLRKLYNLCGFMVMTKREDVKFQENDRVIVVEKEKMTFYELLL